MGQCLKNIHAKLVEQDWGQHTPTLATTFRTSAFLVKNDMCSLSPCQHHPAPTLCL